MLYEKLQESLKYIQEQSSFTPQFGIILGTGLAKLATEIQVEKSFSYGEIPHFPLSTVETHTGRLLFGYLEGKAVVVMQGRFHFYEGYNMEEVTYGVRVMKLLGIEKLFISNAAGGIHPGPELGGLMIINDHINLQPYSPLRGANEERLGPRFPDMFEPYSRDLIELAKNCAVELGISWHEGIYAAVQGPNLETPAEYRYLSVIGADAVGMSTVPEAIVAAHMGLPVFAVSAITDLCYPGALKPVKLSEILAAAAVAEPDITRLIRKMLQKL